MSFDTDLTNYTAAQIIAALGCPRSTAYDWKDGRREPPAWQQPHWLSIIKKKHNKTPHGTPRKSVGKSES